MLLYQRVSQKLREKSGSSSLGKGIKKTNFGVLTLGSFTMMEENFCREGFTAHI